MRRTTRHLMASAVLGLSIALAFACAPAPSECGTALAHHGEGGLPLSGEFINLPDSLAAGRLRTVNRDAVASNDGTAVRVTASQGMGLIWIGGTDFADGAIEADVCGRDVDSKSFIGVAFHRKDDQTSEAVYVRPFNFRASNVEHRQHAVQYVAEPDHDYSRLRAKFPREFEHAVDPSVAPTAWIPLRIVVHDGRVKVFVGQGSLLALDVRELRTAARGQIGLYVDNGSDGVFANVQIVHGS
jgi:hypothetical protein